MKVILPAFLGKTNTQRNIIRKIQPKLNTIDAALTYNSLKTPGLKSPFKAMSGRISVIMQNKRK